MPAPHDFPSLTPHHGLPLLFSGQAQKEFFVNQAFAIVDALLQRTVASSRSSPPSDVSEGSIFRVTSLASGDWLGKEDDIAVRIGGAWHFVSPQLGMVIFDQETEQSIIFRGQWDAAISVPEPTGGSVVDTEARTAIAQLTQELERFGIFT